MIYLLIDNSNSRTKFILANENELLGEQVRVDTRSLDVSKIHEITADFHYDAVLICSVVPSIEQMMESYFADVPFYSLKHDSDHGIMIDYPNPSQIGADRIANVIGVNALFSSPAIVIDFGTAVTFDVIDERGYYVGGVIAPGLGSMNDYLPNRTALLPQVELEEPKRAVGKSTVEAMQAGAVYGYRGLVKGILDALIAEQNTESLIISTGGDGKIIADGVEQIDQFCQKITLEGLRVAAVRMCSGNR